MIATPAESAVVAMNPVGAVPGNASPVGKEGRAIAAGTVSTADTATRAALEQSMLADSTSAHRPRPQSRLVSLPGRPRSLRCNSLTGG